MKKRENKTKYAVLGMLSFAPKSGYEISQMIKNSTAFFWSESDGQIYPILLTNSVFHTLWIPKDITSFIKS